MKQILAKFKYFLSFFKSEWVFEDYPLETWVNPNAEDDNIKFGAKFTNWSTFVAHGGSKQEAVNALRKNLTEYGKKNKLPRPGSMVPIQFAETVRIEKNEEIAVDFFNKIIGVDYYSCFISDLSSLSDFGLDNSDTIEKIKMEYGIEPDSDLFLVDIFEQIRRESKE